MKLITWHVNFTQTLADPLNFSMKRVADVSFSNRSKTEFFDILKKWLMVLQPVR